MTVGRERESSGHGRSGPSLAAPSDGAGGRGRSGCGRLSGPPSEGGHIDHHACLRGRGQRSRRAVPQVRRAVHQPPRRGRPHRCRAGARRDDGVRGPPPRRSGRHCGHPRGRAARVRRRGRVDRRRRHEARADPVRLEGGAAGRHDAQDARRDGEGPTGPDHQAVRPVAQHAHDCGVPRAQATPHRAGDARHLRTVGASPRHAGDEAAARGSRVRVIAPEALRGDRPHGVDSQPGARRVPRRRARARAHAARGAPHHGRGDGPAEAPLEHLREDGREGSRVRRDLRSRRHPRDRRDREGLLRGARLDPRDVEAGARAVQGLHRDAEVQPLPVVAHDRGGARRQAARGADPHA